MAVLPFGEDTPSLTGAAKLPRLVMREEGQRKKVISAILLVILAFQVVGLPGALLSQSSTEIGIAVLGVGLCGIAYLFNFLGRLTVVSVLLIAVVDLGCGLMLLTMPMGLDVADLPVFDVLIVSVLIAVSLLPPKSVFLVAISNILFILAVIALLPRTPELQMLLSSNMAYNAVAQPVSLQIVVALVAYIWVQSALRALARADRAEEIAELQRREAVLLTREAARTSQLDRDSEHLLHVLVRAANGDRTVRASLSQQTLLWRVGSALNVLLTRLRRSGQAEEEVRQLRADNARLARVAYEVRMTMQHRVSNSSQSTGLQE
jgi:hypothetical protein